MPDRFLAVTLALVLALPFFISLDSDLFDQSRQPDPADSPARSSELTDDVILTETAREAARRFSMLAPENRDKRPQDLKSTVTWRNGSSEPVDPRPAKR